MQIGIKKIAALYTVTFTACAWKAMNASAARSVLRDEIAMIVCSPVLLWEQYSGIKTFIKRISRYRTDDFILSKKTAKERLNMQLLRSNNWENYYTSF